MLMEMEAGHAYEQTFRDNVSHEINGHGIAGCPLRRANVFRIRFESELCYVDSAQQAARKLSPIHQFFPPRKRQRIYRRFLGRDEFRWRRQQQHGKSDARRPLDIFA